MAVSSRAVFVASPVRLSQSDSIGSVEPSKVADKNVMKITVIEISL